MIGAMAASGQVAVVGYAQSPAVRHAELSLGVLTVETVRAAVADAGLTMKDVDGFVTAGLFPSAGDHAVVDGVSTVSADWLASRVGAEPRYVSGFQGIGQVPGSLAIAVNALVSGAADVVVLHRALHNPRGRYHGTATAAFGGAQQWTAPQGFFGPLAMAALPTTEYLQRHGATRADVAAVAVEARKNGARLPWSYWHGRPLTSEEYLAAEPLFDPICRYDCDIPVDAATAFVLTRSDRARDLPHRPVYIAGYATSPPPPPRLPLHWPLDDIRAGGAVTAQRLWARSGVRAEEVDLPQVYDGFSLFVWLWLETLGLCPTGEAARFVADGGIDSDRPGAVPALSGGGALGTGRLHGMPQMLECYLQLAGRAGPRQRPGARVGVACHSSPHFGGAVVYTSEVP